MSEIAAPRPLGVQLLNRAIEVFSVPAGVMRGIDGDASGLRIALPLAAAALFLNSVFHWLLGGAALPALAKFPYLLGMAAFYALSLHLLALLLLQTRVSATATLTAVCYAMTPSAFLAFPYLRYLALGWFYLLIFFATRELYGADSRRALVLVVLFALSGLVLETALVGFGLNP